MKKEDKIYRGDNELGLVYLIEGETTYFKQKAVLALEKAKRYEATREYFRVYEDKNTFRLVDKAKVEKNKIELIRVKLFDGRLVWMEKNNAIKKGLI